MMNYYEYISQFQIYSTQKEASKKGFEAHHITPRAIQIEKCGRLVDDSCVRLTRSQHVKAHYLYCLAYPEQSSQKLALSWMLNKPGVYNLSEEEINEYCEALEGWHKTVSEETRLRMSKAKKGKPRSEDWKRKISESLKGKPKNKTVSEETRKKLSETKKGNQHFKGKHHSEEARRKMSEAKKGKPGRPQSEETRKRMAEAHKLEAQLYRDFKSAGGALNWNQWRHYRKETNSG